MASLNTERQDAEELCAPLVSVEQELGRIVAACTVPLRKGDPVVTRGSVTEIFAMPHTDEVPNLKKVDCHFIEIGVDVAAAAAFKDELVRLLKLLPDQESIRGGPSYITMGAILGSQELALQLFGLGEALELWLVITPERLGFTGNEARQMAGAGYVLMTGLKES